MMVRLAYAYLCLTYFLIWAFAIYGGNIFINLWVAAQVIFLIILSIMLAIYAIACHCADKEKAP